VQADVEPWDWHPGALLVTEAGGAARLAGRWFVAAAGAGLVEELFAAVAREPRVGEG
jgi:myo-inositol-1(or 4)-monophosphatase